MSNASTIFDLLGQVDNLNEPVPALNQRPVAFGLLISFLVSRPRPDRLLELKLTNRQVVSYICAIARLYVRFRVSKCPGWDDLLVFLSMVCLNTLVTPGEKLILMQGSDSQPRADCVGTTMYVVVDFYQDRPRV